MTDARRLVAIFLMFIVSLAYARAGECDNRKTCYCQCATIKADARGSGSCSIAEKTQNWCTISYAGNTGSLGRDSLGPSFTTASTVLNLPDHRTPDYVQRVRAAQAALFQPSAMQAIIAGQPPSPEALLLMIRSSYVSSVYVNRDELGALDGQLAELFTKTETASAVSRAIAGIRPFEGANVVATRGYFRLRSGEMNVRFVWRELLPE
ncbi:MAG: hypothetical protein K2Z80_16000 [Xanthobacteraceae bacterium]|nr:hypothetical protein [Xanthobacteraceae bacterium]